MTDTFVQLGQLTVRVADVLCIQLPESDHIDPTVRHHRTALVTLKGGQQVEVECSFAFETAVRVHLRGESMEDIVKEHWTHLWIKQCEDGTCSRSIPNGEGQRYVVTHGGDEVAEGYWSSSFTNAFADGWTPVLSIVTPDSLLSSAHKLQAEMEVSR